GEIQAGGLNLWRDTKADSRFDNVGNNGGSDDGQDQGQGNRLDLFEHERLEEGVGYFILQVISQVGVGGIAGAAAREERVASSSDGVDAEGVEGVIVAEPGFYLPTEEPGD